MVDPGFFWPERGGGGDPTHFFGIKTKIDASQERGLPSPPPPPDQPMNMLLKFVANGLAHERTIDVRNNQK